MDNGLNVCLLNDSFPPQIDGVANAVINYANVIEREFGRAVVAVPKYPGSLDDYPFEVVRYPSLDTTSLVGYRAGVPFSFPLIQTLENRCFDIIHTHCPVASTILARSLREVSGAPVIFTYHTKFDIDIANAIKSEFIQKKAIEALVYNIEACDDVWVVSNGAGENLRSLGYQGDYTVMENGVDIPKGRVSDEATGVLSELFCLPDGVPVYLFVGRIRWYKGLRLTLDSLKVISDNGCDFRMVFVGDGLDRKEIESYAAQLGLSDRCIFTGAIHDRDKLRAWFCRADLFLFPSTFDTNGIVVREAAACGLGTMLIRNSCASEGITDGRNGILIDENVPSMSAALMGIGRDLDAMHRVGQAAGDEIYIPWDVSVGRAVERYHKIIDDKRCGRLKQHAARGDEVFYRLGDLYEGMERLRSGHRQRMDKLHSQMWDRLDRYL